MEILKNRCAMKKIYFSLFAIFLCVVQHSWCMNEKDTFLSSYSRQYMITLQLPDGDIKIEKWKIFSSIALHQEYLRRQYNLCAQSKNDEVKNIVPRYCDTNVEEMKLVSQALDKAPGKEFNEYINQLSSDKRKILFNAVGEFGPIKGQRKLFVPDLIAQCTDYFFKDEKQNLRLYMDRAAWFNHCKYVIVKKSTMVRRDYDVLENHWIFWKDKECLLSIIPLICKDGVYRDEQADVVCYNKMVPLHPALEKAISLDKNCVTSMQSDKFIVHKDNQWSLSWVDHDTQTVCKKIIEHQGFIKGSVLSDNGNYLLTWSDMNMVLSKIECKGSDVLIKPMANIAGEMTKYCFVKDVLIAAVCEEDDKTGLYMNKLYICDLSGECIQEIDLHLHFFNVTYIVGNSDGSKVVICSRLHHSVNALVLCLTPLDRIKRIAHYSDEFSEINQKRISDVVWAPDGNSLVVTTEAGNVVYIDCDSGQWRTLKSNRYGALANNTKVLYSPDSLFVVCLFGECMYLWSTIHRTMSVIETFWEQHGFGFTGDGKYLVIMKNDQRKKEKVIWMKEFALPGSIEELTGFYDNASMLQLGILSQLYRMYKNHDVLEMYEESSEYKAFQLMRIMQECFSVKVIDNNKKLSQVCNDMANQVSSWLKSFY
jgi:WD40 repeat protein